MIEAQDGVSSAEGRMTRARSEFVATLGRRLTALANTLHQLEENPASRERRNMLLRRVHALGSAAKVLGFDGVAEALAEAERALARSAGGGPVSSTDLAEVSRALDVLPSIAWGAKPPPRTGEEPGEALGLLALGWPLSILVYGPATLRASLVASDEDQQIECEVADDVDAFRELAQRVGPDLAVVDGDLRGARELCETLSHDPLIEPFPIIVLGTFDGPEAASSFVSLGAARVLPKPVSPEALGRAVIEASEQESALRGPREPIGDVTVDALAARMAAELRRGLVDGVERGAEGISVPLGEGIDVLAAVWGAVARVREVLTMRSGGKVRFRAGGPEGAVPLAPWTGSERRAGERGTGARRADGVRLEGRRAVVVDDDPSVVWFLSGLLKTSGVEVAEAHDGLRARQLTFDGMPDLVVSDVLMPGLDGFALCREIKRDLAVRDVPVILLSWKEDLLQRVRELGAGADGYLRKEAQASTVLQRVREVLRPRARVEARLQTETEVRGRLDGLTPRLLLELVRRHQPSSRVVIRDAVYLYELEMRDGRPRLVTRTATDGGFERGARVLDALIGVTAGRFVVTPSSSPCRDELGGDLDALLAPRIRRARTVVAALTERELRGIDFVELDVDNVGAYVQATPEPARGLFESLLKGVGPRALVEKDPGCQVLLAALLADIARRGAVNVIVRDGVELDLDAKAEPAPARAEEPLFTLELSAAPPEAVEAMARWELDSEVPRLPLNRSPTPVPPTPYPVFRDEPVTAPGVGPVKLEPSPVVIEAAPSAATEQEHDEREQVEESEPKEISMPARAAGALGSEAPTATPPPAGVELPFEPVSDGVELPSGAFPAEEKSSAPSATPATLRVSPAAEVEERADAEELEPAKERPIERPPAALATLPAAKKIEFPGSARSRAKAPSPSREPSAASTPRVAVLSKPPPAEDRMSPGRIALYVLGAAAVSFGAVTLIKTYTAPEEAPALSSSAAATPSAAAAPAPKPASTAAAPKTEDLALPPGVPLADDKGLLEIDIGERHAIYVDGTFVGRGPMRRVPLAAGKHTVLLKTPDGEVTLEAQVSTARRTRVSLPAPPP